MSVSCILLTTDPGRSIGNLCCFVTFQTLQFDKDPPNTRALVCPMCSNGQNSNVEPLLVSVNHLSALSDLTDWMPPVRAKNWFIIGVPVTVKTEHARHVILNSLSNAVCCLTIICVYFATKKSGHSLELLDCVSSTRAAFDIIRNLVKP